MQSRGRPVLAPKERQPSTILSAICHLPPQNRGPLPVEGPFFADSSSWVPRDNSTIRGDQHRSHISTSPNCHHIHLCCISVHCQPRYPAPCVPTSLGTYPMGLGTQGGGYLWGGPGVSVVRGAAHGAGRRPHSMTALDPNTRIGGGANTSLK